MIALQSRDERLLQNILPSKKDYEVPQVIEYKKPSGFKYIQGLRNQLDTKLINSITLEMCTFHYLEVPLLNQKKPLIMNFTFQDQSKIKFYISKYTLTPNRFNFEEAFQRKQVLRYTEAVEDQLFQSNCLYIAVFSQQHSNIQIKLHFGVSIKRPPKEEQERKTQVTAFQSRIVSAKATSSTMIRDKINQNMNVRQYQPEIQKQVMQVRRVQSARRFHETLNKKNQIDLEKTQIVKYKFEQNEKRKVVKDIMRARSELLEIIEAQQKEWLGFLYVFLGCGLIRKLYCRKVNQKVTEKHRMRLRNKTRLRIRNYMQRKGKTIKERTIFDSFQCLALFCKMRITKQKCQLMLCSFMDCYGQIGEMIQKMYKVRRQLRYVLDSYRNYKKRQIAYVQRICSLWSKYWGIIYLQIQKEDIIKVREIKQKMSKTILNLQIDEEIRKAPYIDIKLQNIIANQFLKSLKLKYLERINQIREEHKGNIQQAYDVIKASTGMNKGLNMFVSVNQGVLKELIYKYMVEKKMIQSVLLLKK
ncbi:hypothetical protein pb186bvf_010072 [Paramecium bursaria]